MQRKQQTPVMWGYLRLPRWEKLKKITKKSGEQQSKNLETLRGDQLEMEFVPESSEPENPCSPGLTEPHPCLLAGPGIQNSERGEQQVVISCN
ncbi:hypothetical protein FKM82_028338 [Ascaphus truei]